MRGWLRQEQSWELPPGAAQEVFPGVGNVNCGNTNVRFERRLLSTPSSPFPAHSSHLRCLLTQFIRCLPIVLALIVVSEIYLARSLETLMSLHRPVFVMLYASLHVKEAWSCSVWDLQKKCIFLMIPISVFWASERGVLMPDWEISQLGGIWGLTRSHFWAEMRWKRCSGPVVGGRRWNGSASVQLSSLSWWLCSLSLWHWSGLVLQQLCVYVYSCYGSNLDLASTYVFWYISYRKEIYSWQKAQLLKRFRLRYWRK